jgi:hypothetical protein
MESTGERTADCVREGDTQIAHRPQPLVGYYRLDAKNLVSFKLELTLRDPRRQNGWGNNKEQPSAEKRFNSSRPF